MVEIEGERVLAASCIRKPSPDMVVKTATDRAVKARRMVMELLLADQPPHEDSPDRVSPFWHWAEVQQIETSRFPAHDIIKPDLSHPAMAVNLDACIDCGLCVRACREVQVNDVIGMAFRGIGSRPVFDFDDPMGRSTCVACGECVQACPTGALMPKSIVDPITQHGTREVDREVHSVCPYCGVGCQLSYQIKDEIRAGPQRLFQREPAVRQRPVRLRLCDQSAAADEAADQEAGPAQGRECRSGQSLHPFPRGDLERGA
jgi:formate dehydrogenase major subunit